MAKSVKNDTARKTIYYRRCVIGGDQKRTLQQLLTSALDSFPLPGNRYEPLNTTGTEFRCIGGTRTIKSVLCGFLTTFERGASQPVVTDDSKASSLKLSSVKPPLPKAGLAPQEYVPGMVYFAVYKNHVALLSTNSMRNSAFELHLNWLLKSRSSLLDPTIAFALSDEAQQATKEKIRASHVKSVALGEPLMEEVHVSLETEEDSPTRKGRAKKAKSVFQPGGRGFDFIRSFFQNYNDFEQLGLDEVFDGNLEVWIEIRYPKRKRIKPEDSVKLMDKLGIALRDIEGDRVSLELANGHRVSGKDLKISSPLDVDIDIASRIPKEDELFEKMVSWLRSQIDNGAVDL